MWSCKISGKSFGQPISNIWMRLFLELKMNKVSTSSATVRFIVRTRAARGSRASATLSMNVGSCVRGCCFWHKFHISSIICVKMSALLKKTLAKIAASWAGLKKTTAANTMRAAVTRAKPIWKIRYLLDYNGELPWPCTGRPWWLLYLWRLPSWW